MAVKGLDIFKLSPKTNCKDCGSPTCMAFCMKVAQALCPIDQVPPYVPGGHCHSDRGHCASHEDRGGRHRRQRA